MQDLKKRDKEFAISTAELIQLLPKSVINNAYQNQFRSIKLVHSQPRTS